MYISKQTFLWYKPGDYIKEEDYVNCENWFKLGMVEKIGEPVVKTSVKDPLDITGDGIVDKKDYSKAGKVLASKKKKTVKRKKK